MTRKPQPSVDDEFAEDVEGNPADLIDQSLPAYPVPDVERDDIDDEYPLEADPADVAAQRQVVPPPPDPPE